MSDSYGNGAAQPTKPAPLVHLCSHAGCDAWGSYAHDFGTDRERWFCRAHDPAQGKGANGPPGHG